MTRHELHLSEGETTARLEVDSSVAVVCQCLGEQGQGVGDAPGQGIGRPRGAAILGNQPGRSAS